MEYAPAGIRGCKKGFQWNPTLVYSSINGPKCTNLLPEYGRTSVANHISHLSPPCLKQSRVGSVAVQLWPQHPDSTAGLPKPNGGETAPSSSSCWWVAHIARHLPDVLSLPMALGEVLSTSKLWSFGRRSKINQNDPLVSWEYRCENRHQYFACKEISDDASKREPTRANITNGTQISAQVPVTSLIISPKTSRKKNMSKKKNYQKNLRSSETQPQQIIIFNDRRSKLSIWPIPSGMSPTRVFGGIQFLHVDWTNFLMTRLLMMTCMISFT